MDEIQTLEATRQKDHEETAIVSDNSEESEGTCSLIRMASNNYSLYTVPRHIATCDDETDKVSEAVNTNKVVIIILCLLK